MAMLLPHRRAEGLALLAAIAVAAGGVAAPGSAAAAPRKERPPRKNDPIPPVEESPTERRAVRGVPVVEESVAESRELRELRKFDEQAIPRPGPPGAAAPDGAEPGGRDQPFPLPGRWTGTGDVPDVLRTPEVSRTAPRAMAPPDSDWLRSLKPPEFPVRWDPLVVRYLDFFKADAKGRAIMGAWLRRLGRYRALFEPALERQGVPKDLVFLAMVESGLDPGSTSQVGAGGIWQFMPGAARAYGLEVSYWVDGRRDPERAVEAAARYLKDLYVRFGSWELVFTAYNAGYGAVLRSIAHYNTNDYWELVRHESGLPWESSVYVPKILAAAIVGHNLEAFGFADVAPDGPIAFDRVEAPPGATFATIARAAGTRVDTIAALNPELVRERTPPDRAAALVRIPAGASAEYAAAMQRSRLGGERLEPVVLRFGETLEDVARARGTTAKDLKRLNTVRDTGELRAGVTILAPRRAGGGETPAKADDEDDDLLVVAVPDRVFATDGRERVFYRTRDADTVEEIADVFRVRTEDLCDWNNVDPAAKLHPRMVLQIFVPRGFDPAGISLLDAAKVRVVTLGSDEFLELEAARRGKKRLFYTCKDGDTLAKVGRRYGLSPGDLARINRFSYATELEPGQKIVVYSPLGELPRETAMGRTPEPRRPGRGATPPAPATAAKKLAKADPARAAAGARIVAPAKPAPKPAPKAAAGKATQPARKPAAPARAAARPSVHPTSKATPGTKKR